MLWGKTELPKTPAFPPAWQCDFQPVTALSVQARVSSFVTCGDRKIGCAPKLKVGQSA